MATEVYLCTFNKIVGWRIAGISYSDNRKISVIKIGSLKLLKFPVKVIAKVGQFCNPSKMLIGKRNSALDIMNYGFSHKDIQNSIINCISNKYKRFINNYNKFYNNLPKDNR